MDKQVINHFSFSFFLNVIDLLLMTIAVAFMVIIYFVILMCPCTDQINYNYVIKYLVLFSEQIQNDAIKFLVIPDAVIIKL